ncbi:MAG: hypothetical protein GY854_14840 [Deltaproteobacteria bacterium]|nr:hypothetical protein [Deltaproteobacteria bacterium]
MDGSLVDSSPPDTETDTSTDTDHLDGGKKDDAGHNMDAGNPDASDSGADGSGGPPSMKIRRK